MAVVAGGQLARVRRAPDAVRPAVIADAAVVDVVDDHGVVVDVGDPRDVYVRHRAVVVEAVALPVTAHIAQPDIAEAIVDAAIESHVGAPVTGAPYVQPIGEPPVSGRPQGAVIGRQHPGAGHPEKSVAVAAPVARHPQIAVGRGRRLHILGQGRRRFRAAVHQRKIRGCRVAAIVVRGGGRSRRGRRGVVGLRHGGAARRQQGHGKSDMGGGRPQAGNPG